MVTVFINPGTEESDTATEDNALKVAEPWARHREEDFG